MTERSKAVAKNLRDIANKGMSVWGDLQKEAADIIDEQAAEIDRLRSQKQFVEGQHAKPSNVYDITGAEPPPPNSGFARLGEFE